MARVCTARQSIALQRLVGWLVGCVSRGEGGGGHGKSLFRWSTPRVATPLSLCHLWVHTGTHTLAPTQWHPHSGTHTVAPTHWHPHTGTHTLAPTQWHPHTGTHCHTIGTHKLAPIHWHPPQNVQQKVLPMQSPRCSRPTGRAMHGTDYGSTEPPRIHLAD
eukprot:115885-Chlamydomonas_euryale.AAC.1